MEVDLGKQGLGKEVQFNLHKCNSAKLHYINKEGHTYVRRKRKENLAKIRDSLKSLERHHSPTIEEN